MKKVLLFIGGAILFVIGSSIYRTFLYSFWHAVIDVVSYAFDKLFYHIVILTLIVAIISITKNILEKKKA